MKAIILSGGGGKGAYQAGCFKAIKELNIKYDIVTGTSIGALNGMLLAQNEVRKCLHLWKHISFKKIYDNFDENNITHSYIEKVLEGGIDTTKIEKLVSKHYNYKKLYSSNVDYGTVAYNLSKLKPIYACKHQMNPLELKKHIIASATCFPLFKLNEDKLMDGGVYDNLPINLAVELGAKQIIAIDLKAIGVKQKVKDDSVKVTLITPNNELSSFLLFDKKSSKQMIKFGYNDTMKVFKKLEGKKFTFYKNHLTNNYNKYSDEFVKTVRYYVNQNNLSKIITKFNNLYYVNKKENVIKIMNEIIEELGILFKLDQTIIYDINKYNKLLIKKISTNETIKNIYDNLNDKIDNKTIIMHPNELLMAIYLKIIS